MGCGNQLANVSGGIAAASPLSERLLAMAEPEARRWIAAPGASQRLDDVVVTPGIRQKLASTPTPGAFSTIRRSMRPIGSSMADTIPGVCAGYVGAQAEWLLGYPEQGARQHR